MKQINHNWIERKWRSSFNPGSFLILLILCACLVDNTQAGKTASKSGLAAATSRADQKSFNQGTDVQRNSRSFQKSRGFRAAHNMSAVQRLKSDLFDRGYDGSITPVVNYTDRMQVYVGLTYRQVLDLDEKNQVLKSLIWFRCKWKDEYISWEPSKYEGITQMEVPHSLIWRPDLVMYEETGVKEYQPRLQRAKISSDGTVRYTEPCVFESTCSIDTAFFPFDKQICHMTFVSWTQPVTQLDLFGEKTSEKTYDDAIHYFVKTGEWLLVHLEVVKRVRDYGVLSEEEHDHSNLAGNDIVLSSTMDPATAETIHKELTEDMFAEIKIIITLRRNSSLYMQSMLFPSILLTTVAILGFYLPPDSGERIGLQITILLTFMVFLLAVGEMFPASTGPYLGVYFVVCMALLGLNLAMTVVVLHLHFKPVINVDPNAISMNDESIPSKHLRRLKLKCCRDSRENDFLVKKYKKQDRARKLKSKSAVPRGLRHFLQLCNRYWSLKEDNARWLYVTTDEEDNNFMEKESSDDISSGLDENATATPNYDQGTPDAKETAVVQSFQNKEHEQDEHDLKSASITNLPSYNQVAEINIETINEVQRQPSAQLNKQQPEAPLARREPPSLAIRRSSSDSKVSVFQVEGTDKTDLKQAKMPCTMSRKADNPYNPELVPDLNIIQPFEAHMLRRKKSNHTKLSLSPHKQKKTSPTESKDGSNCDQTSLLRFNLINTLNDVKGYIKKNEDFKRKKQMSKKRRKRELKQKQKEEEQERIDTEQEEWKSVARAIDVIFFRVYIMCIVVTHTVLLGVAMDTYISKNYHY
ncbi:uncharacterized protein LOC143473203 [Clavelina lepadiformis]|uniref:uncharacterized protein LOC143473203 n=1 Tax=Clavelina lepadiformis TaxID=159417 RepID=UPI004042F034